MPRKYEFSANAERAQGTFRLMLTGIIYPDNKNAAAVVAEKLMAMQDGDVLEVTLRDFEGGHVGEGFKLYDELAQYKPAVKLDGEVCSMGTIIMLAGDTITATKRAKLMTHRPKIQMVGVDFEDVETVAAKGKEMYDKFCAMYAQRTGGKPEEVGAMLMPKGNDVWMTADRAKEVGLVDEVVATGGRTVPIRDLQSAQNPEERLDKWAAVSEPLKPTANIAAMKEIAKKLGLPEDATEAQISAALDGALAAKKSAEDTLAGQVAAEAKRQEQEVTELMEAAVKENRITAAVKDRVLETARKQPAMALAMAKELLPATKPHVGVTAQLGQQAGTAQPERNYEWLMKNEPATLNKLSQENPTEFKRLKDEYVNALREKRTA